MARAAELLAASAASRWGALVGAYSRASIGSTPTELLLEGSAPRSPVVFAGWHEANLLTLILHGRLFSRKAIAFIPPGLGGAAMRGWLEALGIAPVALPDDARRGLGLRQMRAALSEGRDVLIAVDGPSGPRHTIAPGALWLARASGAEVRPVGCAATAFIRLPRWDRLAVPLPGARTVVAIGAPWACGGKDWFSEPAREALTASLHRLTRRAEMALAARPAFAWKEALPWR